MMTTSVHSSGGPRRGDRHGRRGSKWLAALLLTAAVALLVSAIALIVPDWSGEDGRTGASTVAPATRGPLPILNEWVGVAGGEFDRVLEARRSATSTTSTAPAPTTTTTSVPPTHPIADPVRVVIPVIGVNATLIPVGLLGDGAMETPSFGLAGWYKLGPVPGATGPAVVVAHVDTKSGPDVFYRLRELLPGDRVEVHGADGEVAVFVVESQEEVLKKELPTERIWNQTDQALLRLITCGGEFDPASGHYLSNTIVYAHLEAS